MSGRDVPDFAGGRQGGMTAISTLGRELGNLLPRLNTVFPNSRPVRPDLPARTVMPQKTSLLSPSVLYVLSGLAWVLMLHPYPTTVLMAGCVACLTLPLYRWLHRKSRDLAARIETSQSARGITGLPGRVWRGLKLRLIRAFPMTAYLAILIAAIVAPVSILLILVAPQVGAGFSKFRELWQNNFQLPEEWTAYLDRLMDQFQSMPVIPRLIDEGRTTLEHVFDYVNNFSTDTVSKVVNQGFTFLGGTMSVLWTILLLLVLVVVFVLYADRMNQAVARVLRMQPDVLHRFIVATRDALGAVLMGIVFVACIQGALCGIGFAAVGIKQPAFWGLLAALVAPIPMVGTALIWGPLSLHLWFTGQGMQAVALALWGVVFVATADSLLRPFFLQRGIRASYLVLILVILCAIAAFGPVGLIAGPVLLALAIQAKKEGDLAYQADESTNLPHDGGKGDSGQGE